MWRDKEAVKWWDQLSQGPVSCVSTRLSTLSHVVLWEWLNSCCPGWVMEQLSQGISPGHTQLNKFSNVFYSYPEIFYQLNVKF